MNTKQEITIGLCQCGCGQRPKISTQNDPRAGWVKGQPIKFIHGHNMRRSENKSLHDEGKCKHSSGYVWKRCEDHPRSHNGYVLEHILVAEEKIGRLLLPKERVHHENEIKSDNRHDNLTVFPNEKAHQQHHVRMSALKACGNPDWRHCTHCKQYDSIDHLHKSGAHQFYHWECRKIYERTRKLRQGN